jgi:twitching motility two-component system response regulator PilH
MNAEEKNAEVIIFSEDPLSSDSLKFALESKGLIVHNYDNLKACLKHIILSAPGLIILDEIKSGPKAGDIVSGIRRKLKDFDRPFLYILDPPATGKDVAGFDPTIDGYIIRPYSLNSMLQTAFLLMKIVLPNDLRGDRGRSSDSGTKAAQPSPSSRTGATPKSGIRSPASRAEMPTSSAEESAPSPATRPGGDWLNDLKPLEEQQDSISLLGEEEVISRLMPVEKFSPGQEKKSQKAEYTSYKGTVMVIDDEPFIIRILKTILESAGYRALTADNGLEGMKKCKEIIPDLILLDLMMPEIDGYEFTQIIRSEKGFEKVPIVVLSARPLTQDQGKAFKLGASFYMQKPIEREKLLNIIASLISENSPQDH